MVRRTRDDVRDGLAAVWDSGGRRFVTFEADDGGRPDPDRWIQWLDGEINLRWPRHDDPRTALPRLGVALPAGASVVWHVPGENACLGIWDTRIDDVADLVDALFRRVLGAPPAYRVAVRTETHS